MMKTLNDGAESALLPLFNTASLVGFGAVIASLPGFEVLRQGLEGLSGGNVVLTAALSSGALAGITGSASGGMSIALEVLGPSLMAQAAMQGVEPALLHRIIEGGSDDLSRGKSPCHAVADICGREYGAAPACTEGHGGLDRGRGSDHQTGLRMLGTGLFDKAKLFGGPRVGAIGGDDGHGRPGKTFHQAPLKRCDPSGLRRAGQKDSLHGSARMRETPGKIAAQGASHVRPIHPHSCGESV